MSLNKSNTRRLSLLAGVSLIAAVLAAGIGLAPTAALAANECGDPNTNGAAADVFACPSPPTVYSTGIAYTSNGDLTLNVGTGVVSFGTGGLVATAGNLNDDLTVTTSATNLSTSSSGASAGTRAPVVIDLQSQAGDVTVQTAGNIAGVPAFVQYAMRIRSTGAGDVTLNSTSGNISLSSGTNDPGVAAVFASANGGDISIDKSAGNITGRLYGIRAHTSGAGTIAIDMAGNVGVASSAAIQTVAAIDAVSGSGDILMNLDGAVSNGNIANGGVGILTDTDGDVIINARTISGGFSTFLATPRPLGWAVRSSGAGSVTLTLAGPVPTSTLNPLGVTAKMQGGVDFSALAGPAVINLTKDSAWEITRDSVFGNGDDAINIEAGAYLHLHNYLNSVDLSRAGIEPRYNIDLAGGSNSIVNEGTIIVGLSEATSSGVRKNVADIESELRFEGLTSFENSGVIFLGGYNVNNFDGLQRAITSDGRHDDILAMPGADFIATEGSRIVLDASYNGAGQDECDAGLRDAEGDLPGADCVDLRGGSVTGQTVLSIHDELVGDRGAYSPDGTVIIDVSGGTAEADAFVLGADSTHYSTRAGGIIDKGLFVYALGYDEESQQFKLYGMPGSVSLQYPLLAHAANEVWRAGTGGWFDHRRGGLLGAGQEAEFGGGVWVHATGGTVERDVHESLTAGTTVLDFDNSYSQRNTTITAGADLLAGGAGGASWGAGVMVGYNRGEIEFDQSSHVANLEGAHAGVYSGVTAGAFFVDAALNGAWLILDSDEPGLNLVPAGTVVSTPLTSIGGQVEAGWRFAFGTAAIEPLASLAYVSTTIEDMIVPPADPLLIGGVVQYDDAASLRSGLGARFSMTDVAPAFAPVSFSLTAKAIQESEGVAAARIENAGPVAAPVFDALDGTFSEVVGVVGVSNESGTAAGALNVSGLFGDDYRSVNVSLGLRYQW